MADENNNNQETKETKPNGSEEAKPQIDPKIQENEENVQRALDIYNSLQDPSKAKDIVKYLAAKAGVKVQEDDVPVRKATKEVVQDLKEGVPTELHFLIDGLKPAIERMINQRLEPEISSVKEIQMQDKEAQVLNQIERAYEVLRGRYKDFDKVESKMSKLAEDMPHRPGSDMVKYLDNLYRLANSDAKEGEEVKNVVNRINKNASEHGSNIKSAETSEEQVKRGSRLPTLRESVEAGVKGIKFQ